MPFTSHISILFFHFQRVLRPRQNVDKDKKKREETVMVRSHKLASARIEQKTVEIKHFVWHFSHYFHFFRRLDPRKSKSPRNLFEMQHLSSHKNQKRQRSVSVDIFVDGQGLRGLTASMGNTGIVSYSFPISSW